jgi:hypothetical protein
MRIRFYHDPATGSRISTTMASEEEVEAVLRRPGEDRRGREGARVALGPTWSGRCLRVVYVPDPEPDSLCVSTAYELRGKPLAPIDGGSVGKDSDETGQISTRLG